MSELVTMNDGAKVDILQDEEWDAGKFVKKAEEEYVKREEEMGGRDELDKEDEENKEQEV